MTSLKFLQKLHTIMANVDRIKKDKRNEHQKYEYASEKAIKEALHTQFVEQKILMQISTKNPQIVGAAFCVEVWYTFRDIESGDFLEGVIIGTGQTRDEKGNYAAITGAIKYILTSTFLIPTGDDPEKDQPKRKDTQEVKKITGEQLASIESTAQLFNSTVAEIYKAFKIKGVPTFEQGEAMIKALNERKAKLSAELDSHA